MERVSIVARPGWCDQQPLHQPRLQVWRSQPVVLDAVESGQGDVAHSWIGTGPNKTISEGDLASALGGDTLDTLSQQTGMGRDDLLDGFRRYLPAFVDQLTPDGRVPSEDEARRMV